MIIHDQIDGGIIIIHELESILNQPEKDNDLQVFNANTTCLEFRHRKKCNYHLKDTPEKHIEAGISHIMLLKQ